MEKEFIFVSCNLHVVMVTSILVIHGLILKYGEKNLNLNCYTNFIKALLNLAMEGNGNFMEISFNKISKNLNYIYFEFK